MIIAQSVPLGIDRGAPRVFTIEITGIDLTGADLHAQIRLTRDAPGDPIVDLPKVTDPRVAGVRLVATDTSGTLPVSWIRLQIPAMATGTGAGQLPPAAELGDDVTVYWDMFVTPNGRTTDRWFFGPVTVSATVTKSATLPPLVNDPLPGADAVATLVGADLSVTLAGAALIQPLIDRADGSAAAAVDAAAHAETKAQEATDAATQAQEQVGALATPRGPAIVDQSNVKGGDQLVADLTARDAIPADRRSAGMRVKVLGDDGAGVTGREYILGDDLVTWSGLYTQAELRAYANQIALLYVNQVGFDPDTGFEADLTGFAQIELDAGGIVVATTEPGGRRTYFAPMAFAAGVEATSIQLGGVAETNLLGYEADLCGGARLLVDANNRVIIDSDGLGNVPIYGRLMSAYGGSFGAPVSVPSIVLNGSEETVVLGYEADLTGTSMATIGGDGRIIEADDGAGNLPISKPIKSSAGADFAGKVSASTISLNGNEETTVAGYEADLAGTAYEVVGADLRRMAPSTSDAASSLVNYGTATHPDGSLASVVSTAGKLQIAAYDATTGKTAILTGSGSNVAPAITASRRVIYTSDRDTIPKRYWQPIAGGAEWPVDPSSAFAIYGDSISAAGSGIAAFFAAMFPTRATYGNGIGGQRTPAIAQRQTGKPTTGIIAGGGVPASGPVAVTGISLYNGAANRSLPVIVYGADGTAVPGTLTYTSSDGSYAFTRAVAGAAVAVPNPAVIEITSGLAGESISTLLVATQIWITGRNDVGKADYSADAVLADIALMVAALKPLRRQFILCGPINGQVDKLAADGGDAINTTADKSKARFDQVAELNARYAATYPQAYCDWMGPAKAAGLTETYTIGGSTYDVLKASVAMDGLHPNDTVGKPFFAGLVRDFVNAKGW